MEGFRGGGSTPAQSAPLAGQDWDAGFALLCSSSNPQGPLPLHRGCLCAGRSVTTICWRSPMFRITSFPPCPGAFPKLSNGLLCAARSALEPSQSQEHVAAWLPRFCSLASLPQPPNHPPESLQVSGPCSRTPSPAGSSTHCCSTGLLLPSAGLLAFFSGARKGRSFQFGSEAATLI